MLIAILCTPFGCEIKLVVFVIRLAFAVVLRTFMQTQSDMGNAMTTSNHDNAVSAQSQKPKLGLFSSADNQAQHHCHFFVAVDPLLIAISTSADVANTFYCEKKTTS